MRKLHVSLGFFLGMATGGALAAEEAFDACVIFTQADAEKALGTSASPEPLNPKVKRPNGTVLLRLVASHDRRDSFVVGRSCVRALPSKHSRYPRSCVWPSRFAVAFRRRVSPSRVALVFCGGVSRSCVRLPPPWRRGA